MSHQEMIRKRHQELRDRKQEVFEELRLYEIQEEWVRAKEKLDKVTAEWSRRRSALTQKLRELQEECHPHPNRKVWQSSCANDLMHVMCTDCGLDVHTNDPELVIPPSPVAVE